MALKLFNSVYGFSVGLDHDNVIDAEGNVIANNLTVTNNTILANITATNITANTGVFTGNGSGLSSIAGANVTGQVGNSLLSGTVYTNAQPNITSVGTLTSLTVSGNIEATTIWATNNGNARNFRVGDDAWIGDINLSDTVGIRGQQNAENAYIVFGNANGNSLGRAGSGPLTYTGNMSVTGSLAVGGQTWSDAWTTYTPSWTGSSSTPTLGNGSITGRYKQIGKTVYFKIKLTIGSTTTAFGSGYWRFTLPVTAQSSDSVIAPLTCLDEGTSWYTGVAITQYSGNATYVTPVVNNLGVTATAPFTWGENDNLTITGSYEAA